MVNGGNLLLVGSGVWLAYFFLVGVFGVLDVMVVDVEDYIDVYEEVL